MRFLLASTCVAAIAVAGVAQAETTVTDKRAQNGQVPDYLAEALVRSTATGRPTAGHGA